VISAFERTLEHSGHSQHLYLPIGIKQGGPKPRIVHDSQGEPAWQRKRVRSFFAIQKVFQEGVRQ
jgi:hypothetical protein